MEKIVHKLDKESRYKIAVNYVNDKFSIQLEECTLLSNKIAQDLIDNFHSYNESVNKENFDELCNLMSKMNYTTDFFNSKNGDNGRVILNAQSGRRDNYSRGLSFRIYEKNNFQYNIERDCSFTHLTNVSNTDSKVIYSSLIKRNISDDLSSLERMFKELYSETSNSFNDCYNLLKKVRTAELLMKHWSDAYKYLPDDIPIDEPSSLTMSDKFKLL